MDKKDAIILLNGKFSLGLIKKYCKKGIFLICADGASNSLKKNNIIPNIILGDMDSSKKKTLEFFRKKGVKIKKIDDQETTDFEKSLKYCIENNFTDILIFGASGKRQDHTVNIYSVMKRYYNLINLKIIDKKFEIFFINKKIEFNYPKNKLISMMALPIAKCVKTTGLKYKLDNEDLEFGKREGTLNISTSKDIKIEFESGDLLLFKRHFLKN
jgi:thiamine pyrophosphokinase